MINILDTRDKEELLELISSSGGGSSITVDDALSETSVNPVQNKVITKTLDGYATKEDLENFDNAVELTKAEYDALPDDKLTNDTTYFVKDMKIPSGSGGDITIDSELSETSTNPVQNKVVTASLNSATSKTEILELLALAEIRGWKEATVSSTKLLFGGSIGKYVAVIPTSDCADGEYYFLKTNSGAIYYGTMYGTISMNYPKLIHGTDVGIVGGEGVNNTIGQRTFNLDTQQGSANMGWGTSGAGGVGIVCSQNKELKAWYIRVSDATIADLKANKSSVLSTISECEASTTDSDIAGASALAELKDDFKSIILNSAYPVGTVYMSTKNTSPATFLGGTWSAISADKYLKTITSGTGGSTGGSTTSGSTTLTTNQIPSHSHSDLLYGTGGGKIGLDYSGASGSNQYSLTVGGGTSITTQTTGGGQGHTHTINPPYYSVYAWVRTA